MPSGNINTVDRLKRLNEMKELIDQGMSDTEIVKETGMSLSAVRRNKKYLSELAVSDLTPKEVGEKRSEIYIELLEASELAKSNYQELYKESPGTARNYFLTWLKTIEMRMQLYGLDNIKQDTNLTQINNYIGVEREKVDSLSAKKIRESMISKHEDSLKE